MAILGEIDLSRKQQKPSLFLATPDMKVISKLSEAYQVVHNLKLGAISQLTFDIPFDMDINHALSTNPHMSILKSRYLVKLVDGTDVIWYMITEIRDGDDNSSDVRHVTCMSLPYEIQDKGFRQYKTELTGPKNLTQVVTDCLSGTLWTIGYVDASFDTMYRSFTITSKSALDFLFEIATTFKAIIIWDYVNRRASFYKQENIGINRGLVISYRKYLKTLNKHVTTNEMTTRLKVFGKDELSIQAVNPTGTNYIEDFSYFLFPFQRDSYKNVLSHSYYMSDGLCNAILDYQTLVESKRGQFSTLLTNKTTSNASLTTANFNLNDAQTNLKIAQDNVELSKSRETYTRTEFTHTSTAETRTFKLKGGSKYAVLLWVQNNPYTITYNGTVKTVASDTWTLISKEDASVPDVSGKYVDKTVTLIMNGGGVSPPSTLVRVVTVAISDWEFTGSAYLGKNMTSDGAANSVLTTTDVETDWRYIKVGDSVWIENGLQTGFQFSGVNSDLAGIVTSFTSVGIPTATSINSITIDRVKIAGTYVLGYLITTSSNDSIIIARYSVDYQQGVLATKQAAVDAIKSTIAGYDAQIATLRATLDISASFTPDQIKERNVYIIEKEFADSNYIKDTDLYADALKRFNLIKNPQMIIEVDIVNFKEIIEEQGNWDKLNLGDQITIKYDKFGVNVMAKLIEITYSYESGDVKLVIANIKEIENDRDKLVKLLYKSGSTSSTVDMSKNKWDTTTNTSNQISDIINAQWDTAKREIASGTKKSVLINQNGITVTDPLDPLKYLRISNGVMGITGDGGNTFKQAITSTGIVAERLFGQIITGNNLIIGDIDGILKFVGNKGYVYDRAGTQVMALGLYDTNVTTGAESFGLMMSNATHKVIVDKDFGFKIQKKNGSVYDDIAWLDVAGKLNLVNIVASGTIEATTLKATTQLLVGNINVTDLIANGLQVNTGWVKGAMVEVGTLGADRIKVAELIVGTNITMGANATISWTQVNTKPANLALTSDINWNAVKGTVVGQGGITTPMLVATAIDGMTITGSIVRTAASGARVEMNSTGIFGYDAGNVNIFSVTGGNATFKGSIASGSTITSATINSSTISSATINGGSINVSTDATVGNRLYMNTNTAYTGVYWGVAGSSVNLPKIFYDPTAFTLDVQNYMGTLFLSASNAANTAKVNLSAPGGVWAGSQRLDVAPVAVFG